MNEIKSRLQVLCVAMNQNDLTLVEKLNVSSDLIIANQSDSNYFIEKNYPWGNVKMCIWSFFPWRGSNCGLCSSYFSYSCIYCLWRM